MQTQVGYAGGAKDGPTYRSLGDHSEAVQIEYDPGEITYEGLLNIFWSDHSPTTRSRSRPYASIIFFHDEEQRQLAMGTKMRQEADTGRKLYTEIVPYAGFWRAEDYHQKHYLRGVKELMREFDAMYSDAEGLVRSTAAARVNGYLGGHGTLEQLESEMAELRLSSDGQDKLLQIARRRLDYSHRGTVARDVRSVDG